MIKELGGFGKVVTLGLVAAALALAPSALAESRYTVEAECSGNGLEVLVVKWSGYGHALYVYEHGRLIERGAATKRVSANDGRLKIVSYSTGRVTDGGANLRIRVRDTTFPHLEGAAHLTMTGSNDLLQCY